MPIEKLYSDIEQLVALSQFGYPYPPLIWGLVSLTILECGSH